MFKFSLKILLVFFIFTSFSHTEIIKNIEIKGNKRISDETNTDSLESICYENYYENVN